MYQYVFVYVCIRIVSNTRMCMYLIDTIFVYVCIRIVSIVSNICILYRIFVYVDLYIVSNICIRIVSNICIRMYTYCIDYAYVYVSIVHIAIHTQLYTCVWVSAFVSTNEETRLCVTCLHHGCGTNKILT